MMFLMSRRELSECDKRWKLRLWLRLACWLLSFVIGVLFIAAGAVEFHNSSQAQYYPGKYSDYADAGQMGILNFCGLIPALWGLIWNTINVIHPLRTKKNLHPGGVVAGELWVWMSATVLAIVEALFNSLFFWDSNGNTPYHPPPIYYVVYVGVALLVILTILSFWLFIWACRETDLKNKKNRELARMMKKQLADEERASDQYNTPPGLHKDDVELGDG